MSAPIASIPMSSSTQHTTQTSAPSASTPLSTVTTSALTELKKDLLNLHTEIENAYEDQDDSTVSELENMAEELATIMTKLDEAKITYYTLGKLEAIWTIEPDFGVTDTLFQSQFWDAAKQTITLIRSS